jgi:hypothetical protein
VVREIHRLDKIIIQINNFAHPPELEFKPIDIQGTEVATSFPNSLPRVLGTKPP